MIEENNEVETFDFRLTVLNNDSVTDAEKVEQLLSMLQMMVGANIELLDYVEEFINDPKHNTLKEDADYLTGIIASIWKKHLNLSSNIMMEMQFFQNDHQAQ